ncbi:MAG: DUF1570 domain-containing protein [Archangium sp.]|nr:DUF1570 domain-containing protein [Archangium sp.]
MRGALLGLVLLSGCMTTSGAGDLKRELLRFEPAAVTGTGWKRVQTPDYELLTDLEPELATRAAMLLSQSLSGLRAMFGRAPVAREQKLTIIAMRDGLEFERRFGKRTWGFAYSLPDEVTLCLYGPPDRWFVRPEITYEGTHSVLIHELAHAVLARYFVRQAKWFSEGMAQYLETFQWLDAETLRLGDPNLDAYRSYRAIRSLSVDDMLHWSSMNERDLKVAGLYGLSWAFIHYARNREPKVFGQFLAWVAQHGADEAFRQAFGGRGEALDKAIFMYMKQGSYQQVVIKVPMVTPATVVLEQATPEVVSRVETRLYALESAMSSRE